MSLSNEELAQISVLAEKQVMYERKIVGLEEDLKYVKEQLKQVAEKELPNAMSELGLESFL